MSKRTKKLVISMIVAVLIATTILVACSPKEQGRWDASTNVEIGGIPDDACLVNGNPLILNATTESDGGFNLVYVRNNGDIVVKAWLTAPVVGVVLKPAGQFYWTGGYCPK